MTQPPPPPPGAPPPPPPPGAAPLPPTVGTWYSLRGLTTALTYLLAAAVLLGVSGVVVFSTGSRSAATSSMATSTLTS